MFVCSTSSFSCRVSPKEKTIESHIQKVKVNHAMDRSTGLRLRPLFDLWLSDGRRSRRRSDRVERGRGCGRGSRGARQRVISAVHTKANGWDGKSRPFPSQDRDLQRIFVSGRLMIGRECAGPLDTATHRTSVAPYVYQKILYRTSTVHRTYVLYCTQYNTVASYGQW